MRVAILGVDSNDSMESGLKKAFQREGHETLVFWPGIPYKDDSRFIRYHFYARRLREIGNKILTGDEYNYLQRRIRRSAAVIRPDVIITPLLSLISPATINNLKNDINCAVVGWYPDAVTNLGRAEFIFADYDLIYFKNRYLVKRFGAELESPNVRYMPEGFDDSLLDLWTDGGCDDRFDILVYGNLYAYRIKHLETLDRSLSIRVYGPRKRSNMDTATMREVYCGRQIRNDEKVKIMKSARICLNHAHFGETEGLNARAWEAAGLGGFQVTNLPGVREYFDDLIPVYSNPREMNDLIAHYLRHEKERAGRAAAAQRIVLDGHTWRHRVRDFLRDLAGARPAIAARGNKEESAAE